MTYGMNMQITSEKNEKHRKTVQELEIFSTSQGKHNIIIIKVKIIHGTRSVLINKISGIQSQDKLEPIKIDESFHIHIRVNSSCN